jgi:hypothetical protein
MSDFSAMRRSRTGDPHPTLRLAALTAVIVGVILVAVAAFLLSYEGIHQIALQAGVSPGLARIYPLMFDAMLLIACAATLALRNAGWGAKCYVWASLLLVVGAVAVGDAMHATGVKLTGQAARATIAIIPWVLLMMGFGLWLVMLRQWRRTRAMAAADGTGGGRASLATVGSAAAAGGAVTRVAGRGAAPTRTGAPRAGPDTPPERPPGQAPGRVPAAESPAGETRATPGDPPGPRRRITAPEQHPLTAAAAAAGAGAAGAGAAGAAGAGATAARGTVAGTGAEVARARTAAPGRSTVGRTAQDRGNKSDTKPQRGAAGGTSAGSRGDSANADRAGNGTGSGDRRDTPTVAGDDEEGYVRLLPPQPKAAVGDTAAEAPPADRARPGAQGTGATSGQDNATPGQDNTTSGQDNNATPGQDNTASGRDDNAPGDQDDKEPKAEASAGTDDHAGPSPPALAPAPLPDFPRMRSTPTPPRDKEASGE